MASRLQRVKHGVVKAYGIVEARLHAFLILLFSEWEVGWGQSRSGRFGEDTYVFVSNNMLTVG
jgi:hypothetical protein